MRSRTMSFDFAQENLRNNISFFYSLIATCTPESSLDSFNQVSEIFTKLARDIFPLSSFVFVRTREKKKGKKEKPILLSVICIFAHANYRNISTGRLQIYRRKNKQYTTIKSNARVANFRELTS